ncbi:MAG: ATP synthase F1 subunit delta [Bacteroidales bacterium]
MNDSKISVRYAKALFLSAVEKGVVDEVRSDMEYILLLTQNQDVRDLIDSPVVSNPVKRKALTALIKGNVNELTLNLAMLAINNNRESHLAGISRAYIDNADRHNGITKAKLTTVMPLGKEITDSVKKMLEESTGTKIILQQESDPDITGGFLLRVEDLFIDGSVRTQLRKIKKELTSE